MLGDLIEGMHERKSWLAHRLKYLQELIENDPDLEDTDGIVQEYQQRDKELTELNDKIAAFHASDEG